MWRKTIGQVSGLDSDESLKRIHSYTTKPVGARVGCPTAGGLKIMVEISEEPK
jgi:hypothetical protein